MTAARARSVSFATTPSTAIAGLSSARACPATAASATTMATTRMRECYMIAAMKLRIIAEGITVHDEVRQLIERRLNEHAARFGPFSVATITIEKGGLLELHSWKVKAEIELPPSWTVRPDGGAMGAIEDAIEAMFTELTALLRHVTWSRDGVRKPCRWCGHETFI